MGESNNTEGHIIKGVKFGRRPEVKEELIKTESEIGENFQGPINMNDLSRIARDKTAAKFKAERARRRISEYQRDPLTGVLNRKGFDKLLLEETARAGRFNQPLSMLYLDLNGLKQINDTRGHGAGDELIKKAARVLLEEGRAIDKTARWGGDEFAQILPGTTQGEAVGYWQRLNTSFERAGVNISAGLVQIDPSTQKTIAESVRSCDLAMFKAKKISRSSGKNEMFMARNLTDSDIPKVA